MNQPPFDSIDHLHIRQWWLIPWTAIWCDQDLVIRLFAQAQVWRLTALCFYQFSMTCHLPTPYMMYIIAEIGHLSYFITASHKPYNFGRELGLGKTQYENATKTHQDFLHRCPFIDEFWSSFTNFALAGHNYRLGLSFSFAHTEILHSQTEGQ